jgi:transcriptional regulator with XRE-family HTH domain
MYTDATTLSQFFDSGEGKPERVREVLGPRIRQARFERMRGLNLEAFGKQLGGAMGRGRPFSNVTISNWETGRQEPSFEALAAIAQLTHLPLRYFAGVGEIDDYPSIDWLVAENGANTATLETALGKLDSLPAAGRELVVDQLRSLIDSLYRLRAR